MPGSSSALLGERVGTAGEEVEHCTGGRVLEPAEGGAVERKKAAVVLEDLAGRSLTDPDAQLNLGEARL